MSTKKLVEVLKNNPNVKLGVAVATGVAVGVVSTVAIQAYGRRQQQKVREEVRLPHVIRIGGNPVVARQER